MRARLLAGNDGLRTWALVFDTGDEVVAAVEDWAEREGVSAAAVTGIGAFRQAVLGFFSWEDKEYRRIPVDEQVEVLSLVGDLAVADGRPKLHVHVVIGGADATARGGHLLAGEVRPTVELVVTQAPEHLCRVHDPETGLALIQL